jgi:hypothetical protein
VVYPSGAVLPELEVVIDEEPPVDSEKSEEVASHPNPMTMQDRMREFQDVVGKLNVDASEENLDEIEKMQRVIHGSSQRVI